MLLVAIAQRALRGAQSQLGARLTSCTYPYKPGFSQQQRNKVTSLLLAFLGKTKTSGLVVSLKITSIFLSARCERPTGAALAPVT